MAGGDIYSLGKESYTSVLTLFRTGPVFIMIGGEGEENPIWMENGQWINFAKQYVT